MGNRRAGRKPLWMDDETLEMYSFFRRDPSMKEILRKLSQLPTIEEQRRYREMYVSFLEEKRMRAGS